MSYSCLEIVNFIEKLAPPELAENWDNVGLLLGSQNKEINKILLCLDITAEVVNESIRCNADMILSHHPLIFKPLKNLNEDNPKVQTISKLIRSEICVYCAHTNLDAADGGVNDRLAQTLGLQEDKSLKFGKVGILNEEVELKGFISMVKDRLSTNYVRVIGTVDGKIKRVAVFCGSFDEDLFPIKKNEADILVTGDIKYHTALELVESGLCVVDAGHFNTEKIIIPFLANAIKERFPDIDIVTSSVEEDPFKVS